MKFFYIVGKVVQDWIMAVIRYVLLDYCTKFFFDMESLYYRMAFNTSYRQHKTNSADKKVKNDYSDPTVIGRKRRPMHHTSKSFISRTEALANLDPFAFKYPLAGMNEVIMLTGQAGEPAEDKPWDFKLVGSFAAYPEDNWTKPDYTCDAHDNWSTVSLPGHWQLQGHDICIYTNNTYPFTFDPPYAMRDGSWINTFCDLGLGQAKVDNAPLNPKEPKENAVGLYRYTITLPATWQQTKKTEKSVADNKNTNDRIFLVFEGVGSSLTVWLDGVFVGFSKDSCLPAEFDVTDILSQQSQQQSQQHGRHVLAVKVTRWCDGSFLEDQDTWWFSGIYREVYLIRKPHAFISDLEITPTINSSFNKGLITVSILAEGVAKDYYDAYDHYAFSTEVLSAEGVRITRSAVSFLEKENTLSSLENCPPATNNNPAEKDMALVEDSMVATISVEIPEPRFWNCENPYLYTVIVTLHRSLAAANDPQDDGIHTEIHHIGLRSVGMDSKRHTLQVNGSDVTIAGVNRSEFSPSHGRSISRQSMVEDAKLLKKCHFNAVRCSHYPHHPLWYDICDAMGLYVVDEANIETQGFQVIGHAVGYLSSHPDWIHAFLARSLRMFERDKNHCSIIGWSLGNESGYGKAHDLMADWLRKRDSHRRFVQYESAGSNTPCTDIICPMYKPPFWLSWQGKVDPDKRPVVLCEYAHSMGNSGGCLKQYWEMFRDEKNHPGVQGGFVWDFVDQGLYRNPLLPSDGFIYGGDSGETPHTGNFCINGLCLPDRTPLPHMLEVTFLQSPVTIKLDFFDTTKSLKLRVTSRRKFEDLSDLELHISLAIAPKILQKSVTFPTLILPLSCPPGQSMDLEIMQQLLDIFHTTKVDFFAGENDAKVEFLLKEEEMGKGDNVWLEVVCKKKTERYLTHKKTKKTAKKAADEEEEEEEEQDSIILTTSLTHVALSELFAPLLPSTANKPQSKQLSLCKMKVDRIDDRLIITWLSPSPSSSPSSSSQPATVIIDCKDGSLLSWTEAHTGRLLITDPMRLCIQRASTDNDKGGADFAYAAKWQEVGFNSLAIRSAPSLSVLRPSLDDIEGKTEVCFTATMTPEKEVFNRNGLEVPVTIKYTFHPMCNIFDLSITSTFPGYLPSLPRYGLRFAVPVDYDTVRYWGLGPHENYDDRKESAYSGVFEAKVEEMHTSYVVPQENGRRSDPRWVLLSSSSAASQQSIAMIPLVQDVTGYGFNISPYSLETLDRCTHNYELEQYKSDSNYVHVDSRTMGVGGYDSWSPNVDEEFMILPMGKELTVAVRFMTVDKDLR